MWANEMILVLVSIFLATWGAIYLQKNGQKDFSLGFSILITSLILFFVGVTKTLDKVESVQSQYLKALIYMSALFLWIIAFIVGRSHWGQRLTQGPIQIAVIMPLIFWFITRDEVYTWQDTFLYLAFTLLISVMVFRRNKSMFT